MIRIDLQQSDDVLTTINKIKAVDDLNVELVIPEESVLFENILNLKLIQREADKLEKSVEMVTDDEFGNILLDALMGKDIEHIPEEPEEPAKYTKGEKHIKINVPHIKVPILGSAKKGPLIIIFILFLCVGGFIYYGKTAPKAKVTITVGSLPFTRSVTVKIKTDTATDAKNLVLRGTALTTIVEDTLEKETTGTKTVGESARGDIKIYNYTTSEIKLDKGKELTYESDSKNLKYKLKDGVTVPPNALEDETDPTSLKPGEITAEIVATDIGSEYNIDDGKTLKISGYDKDELVAKTKGKLTGGKSEQVRVATQEDKTALSNELKTAIVKKAEEGIKNKLGSSQKLVDGSIQTTISSEKFSVDIDEEADKISLTQTATGEALTYMESDLNRLIDEYFKDIIPEGYYMPEKDKRISVNVLGQSTNSVLNSKEADIQVTLSSIVIPNIKEDDIKNGLAGKTYDEAKRFIESLKNVEHYEFGVSPNIPFFTRVPKDIGRIEVILNKEDTGKNL
ncbi:MAG TPA: hypothetical protein PKH50_01470 [bacterium]|nr:hypothetical protein [bacterium]